MSDIITKAREGKWYSTRWNPMIGGLTGGDRYAAMAADKQNGAYVDFDEASSTVTALLDRIEELEKERDEIAERHRAEICDIAERFRSVNLRAALDMLPVDTKHLLDRAITAESKLAEARAEALEVIAELDAAMSGMVGTNIWWTDCGRIKDRFVSAIRALKSGGENG